ncbi:zinc finger HIT domain-containing protein 2-like [Anneissia japonica]|uniref:zinc finger HIT domain-containing protein 2-like n=1 Tax=Anneissia japonica TaxID=1529436 RepID=UPI001425AD51|nr:zinc finger HIT domain-containing protein 2-like [Anneissia japonica]
MAASLTSNVKLCTEETPAFKDKFNQLCKLCLKETAKYVCPRCNVRYCSLDCYKSSLHADCSESFYKESVMDEMKKTKKSPEERQQVMDMLRRLEEEDQQYQLDSNEDSLEHKLALFFQNFTEKDSDRVWEQLTQEEKEGFERLLKNDKLGGIMEMWVPWWVHHSKSLVEEVSERSEKSHQVTMTTDMPEILPNIAPFNQLLKTGSPSPVICFNCVHILYCYVYTVRFYNGQHHDLPLQSAQSFLQMCGVFSENRSYDTVSDAIHSAMATVTKAPAELSSNMPPSSIVEDVLHLLTGPAKPHDTTYIQAAFSDLHTLFYQARKCSKKAMKSSNKSSQKIQGYVKMYFQCQKKLEFYLSWLMQYGDKLSGVRSLVHVEHCDIQSEEEKQEGLKNKVKDNLKKLRQPATKHKLIEEL